MSKSSSGEHEVIDFVTKNVYIFKKNDDNKWVCGIDDCSFTNVLIGKLNAHLKTKKHNISAAEISRPTCIGYTTNTGEVCSAEFSSPAELKRHMASHLDVKPYACTTDGCKFTFAQKSQLESHVSTVHLKERNFACLFKDCKQTFARAEHLSVHHATVHDRSLLETFSCDICNNHVTNQQSHLTQHKADVHKINAVIKYCTIDDCTREFTQSSNFKSHQRDIHGV